MKHASLIVVLLLTGCVSVELPGALVSDTVRPVKTFTARRRATSRQPLR